MARAEVRPARVLMVTERYLPDCGGTERQLQLLARTLAARGFSVEVVMPRASRSHAAYEVIQGITVHRLPFLRVRYLATVTTLLSLACFLLRHARRFDVFHAHTVHYLAVVSTAMGWLLRKRVVLKAVGWWELDLGVLSSARCSRLDTRVCLAVLRRADVWVAVSRQLEDAMLAAGVPRGRVRYLPNGVDVARYAPGDRLEARRRLGMALDRPRVVFVGRLVPEKGLTTLLRAWRAVTEKVPAAHLDIIGAGPLRRNLEEESRRLEIERCVTLHGEQPDVIAYLQAADCFVLPSTVEGMSNALLEAMAVGLPIVASRIGGTESLLEDSATALLVTPDDPDNLARGISAVLEDPERSAMLGERARARTEQLYGIDRVADVYVRLYCRGFGA